MISSIELLAALRVCLSVLRQRPRVDRSVIAKPHLHCSCHALKNPAASVRNPGSPATKERPHRSARIPFRLSWRCAVFAAGTQQTLLDRVCCIFPYSCPRSVSRRQVPQAIFRVCACTFAHTCSCAHPRRSLCSRLLRLHIVLPRISQELIPLFLLLVLPHFRDLGDRPAATQMPGEQM